MILDNSDMLGVEKLYVRLHSGKPMFQPNASDIQYLQNCKSDTSNILIWISRRLQASTEAMQNMKTLKLNCWEEIFLARLFSLPNLRKYGKYLKSIWQKKFNKQSNKLKLNCWEEIFLARFFSPIFLTRPETDENLKSMCSLFNKHSSWII